MNRRLFFSRFLAAIISLKSLYGVGSLSNREKIAASLKMWGHVKLSDLGKVESRTFSKQEIFIPAHWGDPALTKRRVVMGLLSAHRFDQGRLDWRFL